MYPPKTRDKAAKPAVLHIQLVMFLELIPATFAYVTARRAPSYLRAGPAL